jgi:hypothetical protein
MTGFPTPLVLSRYADKVSVKKIASFKRGQVFSRNSRYKERIEIKELGQWMERKIRELEKG